MACGTDFFEVDPDHIWSKSSVVAMALAPAVIVLSVISADVRIAARYPPPDGDVNAIASPQSGETAPAARVILSSRLAELVDRQRVMHRGWRIAHCPMIMSLVTDDPCLLLLDGALRAIPSSTGIPRPAAMKPVRSRVCRVKRLSPAMSCSLTKRATAGQRWRPDDGSRDILAIRRPGAGRTKPCVAVVDDIRANGNSNVRCNAGEAFRKPVDHFLATRPSDCPLAVCHYFWRRREPDEIERESANERRAIRFRLLNVASSCDEGVDWVPHQFRLW